MENPYSLVFGHMRLQAFVDVEKQLHYHLQKNTFRREKILLLFLLIMILICLSRHWNIYHKKTIRRILIIVYLEIFDRFLFDFLENYKYNEERTSSKSA